MFIYLIINPMNNYIHHCLVQWWFVPLTGYGSVRIFHLGFFLLKKCILKNVYNLGSDSWSWFSPVCFKDFNFICTVFIKCFLFDLLLCIGSSWINSQTALSVTLSLHIYCTCFAKIGLFLVSVKCLLLWICDTCFVSLYSEAIKGGLKRMWCLRNHCGH